MAQYGGDGLLTKMFSFLFQIRLEFEIIMSQHFKSLLSQLQPFLNKTPSPGLGSASSKRKCDSKFVAQVKDTYATANLFCLSSHKFSGKKIKINLESKQRSSSRKLEFKSDCSSSEFSSSSSLTESLSLKTTVKANTKDFMTDSGVESSSTSIKTPSSVIYDKKINKSCECNKCVARSNRRNQIEKNLKLAFINYLKTSSESSFANLPLLIVRSFKPSLHQLKIDQLSQIEVKKGTAINALFMKDNIWIYVKTSTGQTGFIPKKYCEPFVIKSCPSKNEISKKKKIEETEFKLKQNSSKVPKLPLPEQPKISNQMEHTYMTINDNETFANLKNTVKTQGNDYVNESSSGLKTLEEEMSNGNQTNIALMSVSNFVPLETDEQRWQSESNKNAKSVYEKMALKSKSRKLMKSSRRFYEMSQNYENLFEFSNPIKSRRKSSISSISPIFESQIKNDLNKAIYDDLGNFQSVKPEDQLTPTNSKTSTSNYYDALMTMKSYKASKNTETENFYLNVGNKVEENDYDHVYDHLSCTNSKFLNIFRVINDYRADFKGDLSVEKGDLVCLVDKSEATSEKSNEWLLVKLHRINAASDNLKKSESFNYQGYIPASHVVRI